MYYNELSLCKGLGNTNGINYLHCVKLLEYLLDIEECYLCDEYDFIPDAIPMSSEYDIIHKSGAYKFPVMFNIFNDKERLIGFRYSPNGGL